MGALRFSDRRVISTLASLGLLVGMVLPAVVPSFASAAEVTDRSVEMSSTAVSATGVKYTVSFTPVAATAAGFVIDFCEDTPLVGNSCTQPSGMSTTGVGTSTAGASVAALTGTGETGVAVTYSMTTSPVSVELTGITNPNYSTDSTHGFYARIVTYSSGSDISASSTNTTPGGSKEDTGGVALSLTNSFAVSGSVLESMTFCVSGTDTSVATDPDCSDGSNTLTTPDLSLGTDNGGTYVLSNNSTSPSTGTIYTQLSTNAVNGAVVNLHSNATGCGGLVNIENSADCIAPAPNGGVASGGAGFGVKTGASTAAATTNDTGATGAIDPATGYSDSTYYMDFTSGGSPSTGVTSPYGSPILNSNNAPVNDMNMPLVFAANSNANTPAGNYSATLNLIADGTF